MVLCGYDLCARLANRYLLVVDRHGVSLMGSKTTVFQRSSANTSQILVIGPITSLYQLGSDFC